MFVISWILNGKTVYAGSIHDWENSPNADGVIKWNSKEELELYVKDNQEGFPRDCEVVQL